MQEGHGGTGGARLYDIGPNFSAPGAPVLIVDVRRSECFVNRILNCKAVLRIVPQIDMDDVRGIIEETPCLSRERRHFYETMLEYRYELILERAYLRVSEDNYDVMLLWIE